MWISYVLAGRTGSRDLTKSYWLHWWWWLWEPKFLYCNNEKTKGNQEFMLVTLKCVLLSKSLMGGLYPNLYYSACHMYVHSRQLWIYTIISILTQLLAPRPNPKLEDNTLTAPATAYSIYSQLPSIFRAVPPSATWGRAMPCWQGPNYLNTQWLYRKKSIFTFGDGWGSTCFSSKVE